MKRSGLITWLETGNEQLRQDGAKLGLRLCVFLLRLCVCTRASPSLQWSVYGRFVALQFCARTRADTHRIRGFCESDDCHLVHFVRSRTLQFFCPLWFSAEKLFLESGGQICCIHSRQPWWSALCTSCFTRGEVKRDSLNTERNAK